MKSRVFDRSDPSCLRPEWTEKEMSLMIELWRELESNPAAYMQSGTKSGGSIASSIAQQLSQRTNKTRSSDSIECQRRKLYKVVQLVNRFNEMQQVSGGRLWFDLPREKRNQVEMPTPLRKTSSNLTRASYHALLKFKSVRKWAKVPKAIASKPKDCRVQHPSKCSSCWSSSEVKALVQSWSRVMKKSNTLASDFMAQSYDESATLYTPWNHSTLSAWRKMRRIAASYLFIRAFNERHAPVTWFQISDSEQNLRMDWYALPAEFENISGDIFAEMHRVDSILPTPAPENGKADRVPVDMGDRKSKKRICQALFGECSSSDECDESPIESMPNPPKQNLCMEPSQIPGRIRPYTKRTRQDRQDCNTLYEPIEKLQKKQFKKTIKCLRADVERDLRLSTDMVRSIFFDRFGEPGEAGTPHSLQTYSMSSKRKFKTDLPNFKENTSGTTNFKTPRADIRPS